MAVVALLLVELLDELVYGSREASWPLIQHDLGLQYVLVGLIIGAPNLVAAVIEPVMGIMADAGRRRALILGGGVVFGLALVLFGASQAFLPLLIAASAMSPASGAFVSLSQATLMDAEPGQRERNMVRWTIAGSVGALVGPLVLSAALRLGLSWRIPFMLFAGLAFLLVPLTGRHLTRGRDSGQPESFRAIAREALQSLRRDVLGWLSLLIASDLLQDVFLGFLALYLVDAVHLPPSLAALSVTVWVGANLAGTVLLLPALKRVPGLTAVLFSALATLVLFPAFLLVPLLVFKGVLLALLGFSVASWYPVLKAQLYETLPDRSGTAMAVSGVTTPVEAAIPLGIGLLAQSFGLGTALWFLLLGPLCLIVGLAPRVARHAGGNS